MIAVALVLLQAPFLDPYVRTSKSGEYRFEVDPSDPEGSGPGNYRLERRGSVVWSGERPFTLWEAAVADSGIVIGYAYTYGIVSAPGELQLVRIDVDGEARVCGAQRRRSSDLPHGGAAPSGLDVDLIEAQDLAIVGVGGGPAWFVRISTGECLPPTRLAPAVASRPHRAKPVFTEPPSIDLPFLGSVELGGSRSDHEIACVEPPSSAPDAGSSCLRPTSDWEAWELVLRGPHGDLRTVVTLGGLRGAGRLDGPDPPQAVRCGEHAWVVVVSEHAEAPSHAWTVDDRSGRAEKLHGFACPAVWGLAPLPDAGFAVLANRRDGGASVTTLRGYDRDGVLRWTVPSTTDLSDSSRLYAPANVVANVEGELVVRDPVRGLEQRFDSGGSFQGARTFAVGAGPLPEASAKRSVGHVGRIRSLAIDPRGFACTLDHRSPTLTIFDPTGRRLRSFRMDPADFEGGGPRGPELLALGPDGSVYVHDDSKRPNRYLAFQPDGSRRGWESLGVDRNRETWRFAPNGDRWVVGYRTFALCTADGTQRRIDRQPDRRWIQYPQDAAIAPDGSVALLTARGQDMRHHEFWINLYSSDGTPVQTLEMPPDSRQWGPAVVWNGRWLAVARDRGRLHLVHVPTGRRATFAPDWIGAADASRDPFLVGDDELWIADRELRIVRRYSLPSD